MVLSSCNIQHNDNYAFIDAQFLRINLHDYYRKFINKAGVDAAAAAAGAGATAAAATAAGATAAAAAVEAIRHLFISMYNSNYFVLVYIAWCSGVLEGGLYYGAQQLIQFSEDNFNNIFKKFLQCLAVSFRYDTEHDFCHPRKGAGGSCVQNHGDMSGQHVPALTPTVPNFIEPRGPQINHFKEALNIYFDPTSNNNATPHGGHPAMRTFITNSFEDVTLLTHAAVGHTTIDPQAQAKLALVSHYISDTAGKGGPVYRIKEINKGAHKNRNIFSMIDGAGCAAAVGNGDVIIHLIGQTFLYNIGFIFMQSFYNIMRRTAIEGTLEAAAVTAAVADAAAAAAVAAPAAAVAAGSPTLGQLVRYNRLRSDATAAALARINAALPGGAAAVAAAASAEPAPFYMYIEPCARDGTPNPNMSFALWGKTVHQHGFGKTYNLHLNINDGVRDGKQLQSGSENLFTVNRACNALNELSVNSFLNIIFNDPTQPRKDNIHNAICCINKCYGDFGQLFYTNIMCSIHHIHYYLVDNGFMAGNTAVAHIIGGFAMYDNPLFLNSILETGDRYLMKIAFLCGVNFIIATDYYKYYFYGRSNQPQYSVPFNLAAVPAVAAPAAPAVAAPVAAPIAAPIHVRVGIFLARMVRTGCGKIMNVFFDHPATGGYKNNKNINSCNNDNKILIKGGSLLYSVLREDITDEDKRLLLDTLQYDSIYLTNPEALIASQKRYVYNLNGEKRELITTEDVNEYKRLRIAELIRIINDIEVTLPYPNYSSATEEFKKLISDSSDSFEPLEELLTILTEHKLLLSEVKISLPTKTDPNNFALQLLNRDPADPREDIIYDLGKDDSLENFYKMEVDGSFNCEKKINEVYGMFYKLVSGYAINEFLTFINSQESIESIDRGRWLYNIEIHLPVSRYGTWLNQELAIQDHNNHHIIEISKYLNWQMIRCKQLESLLLFLSGFYKDIYEILYTFINIDPNCIDKEELSTFIKNINRWKDSINSYLDSLLEHVKFLCGGEERPQELNKYIYSFEQIINLLKYRFKEIEKYETFIEELIPPMERHEAIGGVDKPKNSKKDLRVNITRASSQIPLTVRNSSRILEKTESTKASRIDSVKKRRLQDMNKKTIDLYIEKSNKFQNDIIFKNAIESRNENEALDDDSKDKVFFDELDDCFALIPIDLMYRELMYREQEELMYIQGRGGNYSKIDELKLDKSIKKYINILGKKRRIYTKIGSKKEYIKTKNHFVLIKDFIKLHSKSSIKPSKTIKDTKLPKSKPKPKVNKASQEAQKDINISPKPKPKPKVNKASQEAQKDINISPKPKVNKASQEAQKDINISPKPKPKPKVNKASQEDINISPKPKPKVNKVSQEAQKDINISPKSKPKPKTKPKVNKVSREDINISPKSKTKPKVNKVSQEAQKDINISPKSKSKPKVNKVSQEAQKDINISPKSKSKPKVNKVK